MNNFGKFDMGYPVQAVSSYDFEVITDPQVAFYNYLSYLIDENERFLGKDLDYWLGVLIDELAEILPDDTVDDYVYMFDRLKASDKAEKILDMFKTMPVGHNLPYIFDALLEDMSMGELENLDFVKVTEFVEYYPR